MRCGLKNPPDLGLESDLESENYGLCLDLDRS